MAKPVKHYGKWRIRWLDADGRRRSEVYERYEDAAFKLQQHELHAKEILRGLRARPVERRTVGDACDYWLEHRANRKRSGRDDKYIIDAHLRRALGHLSLAEVNQGHIDTYIGARCHLSIKTVANHLTLLIAILNLSVDLGWLDRIPRLRKPRIPLFTTDYSFLRTGEEIQRFLRAALAESDEVHALYATACYTGMRAGELAGLRWGDVDIERRLITVQRSFAGPTKAGDVRYVPILDPLLPILREECLKGTTHLVFPNQRGRMHQSGARVFQEILHRVLAKAGFSEIERGGKIRPYISFHSLRHTFASHWVMNGGDLFKLQKILGHKTVQMTMRYAHLAPDAFAEDFGRLGSEHETDGCRIIEFPSR